MKKEGKKSKSVLRHLPNVLTLSRIIITFLVMYLIFARYDIRWIIALFAVGALTDLFDGWLARRYNWGSEIGRKMDLIADRFLWMGTAIAFVVAYSIYGLLGQMEYMQLVFIMAREIITAPFTIFAFFRGTPIPHATKIAKVTTFIQGFALPALILSIYYPIFVYVSLPLSIVLLFIGVISAGHYINKVSS